MSIAIPGKVEFLVPLATMMCASLIAEQLASEHRERFGDVHTCDHCNAAKMLSADVEKRILSIARKS